MENSFVKEYSPEARVNVSTKIIEKYPNRIPLILEKAYGSKLPNATKSKYLVPRDISTAQGLYELRLRIPEVKAHQAIFFFINGKLLTLSETMGNVYEKNKDPDGLTTILQSNSF